jgi:hypothetical protein
VQSTRPEVRDQFADRDRLDPVAQPVPFVGTTEPEDREGETGSETQFSGGDLASIDESSPKPRPRNYSWAELMRRVFEVDVLDCPECGGLGTLICPALTAPRDTFACLH